MPDEKESKPKPAAKRPPVLDVHRHIRELDVVWYHHSCWACVRLTDCSAKLVEVGPNWAEATGIRTDGNGIRVSPGILVGSEDGVTSRDSTTMWLIGRLTPGQIIREETPISPSRGRTIIGTVDVPMPGFAPSAKRKRAPVEVESASDDSPIPAPLDPILMALQSAAEQFARVLGPVAAPAGESSAATE